MLCMNFLANLSPSMYKTMHEVSEQVNFPFVAANITFARLAFMALYEGWLSKFCNERRSVFGAVMIFYCALMFEFIEIVRGREIGLDQYFGLFGEIERDARKDIHPLIERFEKKLEEIDDVDRILLMPDNISKKE